jgi:hypothetical protein
LKNKTHRVMPLRMKTAAILLFVFLGGSLSALAAQPPIALGEFEGKYDSVTLDEFMKHGPGYPDGKAGVAAVTYSAGLQLEGVAGSVEQLTIVAPDGFSPTRTFEYYRDANGVMYFVGREQGAGTPETRVLVRMKQSATDFAGGYRYRDSGETIKLEEQLQLPDSRHLTIRARFSCCKASLGHLGCLYTGMCEDRFTLSR